MNNLINLIKKFSLIILVCFVSFACDKDKKTAEVTAVECPKQPKTILASNNVKTIDFRTQSITQSGMVNSNKSLGYTFEARSGQKLGYSTNQDICLWIYTPDNQILSTPNLPTDGKYTIQISALKGSTTFDLTLSLDNVTAAATPTPISSPTLSTPVRKATINNKISVSSQNNSYRTQSSRSSPATAINNYYINLNQSDYRNAWNTLSNNLRTNKKEHPKGYDSYLEWWQQVKYIDTQILGARNSGDSATVTVRCKYNFVSGRRSSATVKYYLLWSNASNTWKINRVERI
jgi:hypothetical protein